MTQTADHFRTCPECGHYLTAGKVEAHGIEVDLRLGLVSRRGQVVAVHPLAATVVAETLAAWPRPVSFDGLVLSRYGIPDRVPEYIASYMSKALSRARKELAKIGLDVRPIAPHGTQGSDGMARCLLIDGE
jgi:hypothetical protein